MPAKKLLEPQKWFGIFHEIGHEAFNLMSTEIQKMNLFDYARQAGLEGPDAKDYLDFLWEVFSDIFDYQNGFNKDWEIYFKSIWEYLLSLYGIKPTYIARSVLVYLTVGPEAKLFEDYSSEIAIQKVAEKICNDVETIQKNIKKETNNGNKLDWNLLKSEAIRLALVSLEGVKQLKNLMHERKGPILSKKELENLVSELKSGKVVDEVNPVDIIRALVITNRTNKINLVTKVSAIISLWNYTTKQISQKSDEVQLKLDKLTTME